MKKKRGKGNERKNVCLKNSKKTKNIINEFKKKKIFKNNIIATNSLSYKLLL